MAELDLDSPSLDDFLCISMYEEEGSDDIIKTGNDCSQHISDAD